MFKTTSLLTSFLLLLCSSNVMASADALEARIDQMLSKMSVEEKIGQTALRGISSRHKGPLPQELIDDVRAGRVGAFLNVMEKNVAAELQRIAAEESPHKIPLLFGRDVIHGFKTIAPIPLGLAASWNPELVQQSARNSAVEASTYGIRWTYAPMVDISRDARWGRIAESLGEDPYLASTLAVAMVNGFQGDDLSDPTSLAACVKHYAGYGAAEGGRDYNTANIPEGLLRDIYLPPFKAAAKAGAASFMSSFNEVNGIPATGNHFLLTEVLKNEWGFDGFIVSDWDSVIQMVPHGYAADNKHAAERAASAGLDMEMMSTAYEDHLAELLQEGKIKESQLDDFVRRILRIKLRLGLFEQSSFNPEGEKIIQNPAFLADAKQAAIESLVLLKNENNLLPLSKHKTIAVIGPLADAPHEQLGTWTYDGEKTTTRTVLPALRESFGKNRVLYSPGLIYSRSKDKTGFDHAVKTAEQADVIIFVGGEEAILSGEAHSRADIRLPGVQEELITALSKTGKPIALVIIAGRPISVNNIIDKVDSLLMAWHPGTMGGPAIADVLTGIQSPSGRLPITWPKSSGQIPIYYNHTNTGRPVEKERFIGIDEIPVGTWQSGLTNTSYYMDIGYEPQFPFGFGLSYTNFAYEKLKLNKSNLKLGDTLKISILVSNTGKRSATETVQLYTQDIVGEVTRPVRELKGFKRIMLKPRQSQRMEFELQSDALAYHHPDGKAYTDPGQFNLWVGPNSATGLQTSFSIKE